MNIEIANRLVQLRKEHNLSQEALAAKIGISRQAISKWERAEASPDTDNLMALAQLYGMSLDDLINAENDRYVLDAKVEQDAQEAAAPVEKSARQKLGVKLCKFPAPILIVIAYLLFGFGLQMWHPAWIILLLIPMYYWLAGALCCRKKKAMLLTMPFPLVIVVLYLALGFGGSLWHPGWILFLTIPLYYWLISVFYKEPKA